MIKTIINEAKAWWYTIAGLARMAKETLMVILNVIVFKITYKFKGYDEWDFQEYGQNAYDYLVYFMEEEEKKAVSQINSCY